MKWTYKTDFCRYQKFQVFVLAQPNTYRSQKQKCFYINIYVTLFLTQGDYIAHSIRIFKKLFEFKNIVLKYPKETVMKQTKSH